MATLTELSQKITALETALEVEQAQVAQALSDLQGMVDALQALVEDAGTPEERQALADRLDAVRADLESTISDPDEEEGGEEEEQV